MAQNGSYHSRTIKHVDLFHQCVVGGVHKAIRSGHEGRRLFCLAGPWHSENFAERTLLDRVPQRVGRELVSPLRKSSRHVGHPHRQWDTRQTSRKCGLLDGLFGPRLPSSWRLWFGSRLKGLSRQRWRIIFESSGSHTQRCDSSKNHGAMVRKVLVPKRGSHGKRAGRKGADPQAGHGGSPHSKKT